MTPGRILTILAATAALCSGAWAEAPRYVILLVADGLGGEQLKAASIFYHGVPGRLAIEGLPESNMLKVLPAADGPADEAAAATALATGKVVNRGVISMNIPGSAKENPGAETVLEYMRNRYGHSLGIVTDSRLTNAAPAAFAAHQPTHDRRAIVGDYLQLKPDLLMGLAETPFEEGAAQAGYSLMTTLEQLDSVQDTSRLLIMLPGADAPDLEAMTRFAIARLQDREDGFYLVIHSGRIADACRRNDIQACIEEVARFDRAVAFAAEWAKDREKALLVATATAEFGGLEVLTNNGLGRLPDVRWSTDGQTDASIPVYAMGLNSRLVGLMDGQNVHLSVVLTFDEPGPRPRKRSTHIALIGAVALMLVMWLLCRGSKHVKW